MHVLGLSFVRNAEAGLQGTLDSMSTYCDTICVVDDRSTDGTGEIVRRHPAVSNLFTIDHSLSHEPWHFPESWFLALLYRMADFYQPGWIVMLSADECIEQATMLRERLSRASPEVAGFQLHLVSAWDDPHYPYMVPIMGQGRSLVGRIWRYHLGLLPGTKRLHNSYFPLNITDFGRVDYLSGVTIAHSGWSTLAERIAKVDLYTSIDPSFQLNDGVPYDLGLLFGYERHRIDELVHDYARKLREIRGVQSDRNRDRIA